jgi:hypothetical protein
MFAREGKGTRSLDPAAALPRIAWSQVASYHEYQSVCHLLRLGTPPSPAGECVPPGTKVRNTLACG